MPRRLAWGILFGICAEALDFAVERSPLTAVLDIWSVASFACGLALGPAGVAGSLAVFAGFKASALAASADAFDAAVVRLVAYAVLGFVPAVAVRRLPRLRRALAAAPTGRSSRERARRESLVMVHHLTDRLHRSLDVESIAREAVDELIRLSNPPLVAVYLIEDDGGYLRLVAHHGFDDETLAAGGRLPLAGSLNGVAIAGRDLVICEHAGADPRVTPEVRRLLGRFGLDTVVVIPLLFEERALGTISLVYEDPPGFSAEDLDTFRTIGHTVALAIVSAERLKRLEHQAFHDSLTGLPNRAALHADFPAIAAAAAEARAGLVLILFDLDRFKEINDALGHHVGDQLLTEIGPRVRAAFGSRQARIYRLGGDEFAVVVSGLEPGESDTLGEALLAALRSPFKLGGLSLQIGASAGMSAFPAQGGDSHELLRCSDVAMYHAKNTSTGVATYEPSLDHHTPERLALASELERSVRDRQLLLHFQPTVELGSGKIVGFEALARWQHERLGLLPPSEFIPLAEVGDLIHPLTYWVVEEALTQLRRWSRVRPGLTMAVNLSTRNLLDRSCAENLGAIIERVGVEPRCVEFELTETALIGDPERAVEALKRIAATGARLAIDDFGTGYSSLASLKRLPIDRLKIDLSFVAEMLRERQSLAIIRSIVRLAGDLGIGVVAEGVENRETAEALRELGCALGQGFFFGRPAPAREVDLLLAG